MIVFITATHIHVVGEFVVVDSHAIAQTYNVFTTYCHNIHILIIRHKGSDYISYRQNRGWMLTKKCSEAAYAQKKRAEAKEKKLALVAKSIPKVREYLSIREAVAIYGFERDTLYLMVRRGQIPSINIGTRLTRINRKDLEKINVISTPHLQAATLHYSAHP